MRFPRALSIREDLSSSDCVTASGAEAGFLWVSQFSHPTFSYPGSCPFSEEKKDGGSSRVCRPSAVLSVILTAYQEKRQDEAQSKNKGILYTNPLLELAIKVPSQPSVLPEYRGVDLKDVQTQSNLFEGLSFSEFLVYLWLVQTSTKPEQWCPPIPSQGQGMQTKSSY